MHPALQLPKTPSRKEFKPNPSTHRTSGTLQKNIHSNSQRHPLRSDVEHQKKYPGDQKTPSTRFPNKTDVLLLKARFKIAPHLTPLTAKEPVYAVSGYIATLFYICAYCGGGGKKRMEKAPYEIQHMVFYIWVDLDASKDADGEMGIYGWGAIIISFEGSRRVGGCLGGAIGIFGWKVANK